MFLDFYSPIRVVNGRFWLVALMFEFFFSSGGFFVADILFPGMHRNNTASIAGGALAGEDLMEFFGLSCSYNTARLGGCLVPFFPLFPSLLSLFFLFSS